jgi:leucyl-tRNA synthetase
MIFVNWWYEHQESVGKEAVLKVILLLAPFAPYLSEELYSQINATRV